MFALGRMCGIADAGCESAYIPLGYFFQLSVIEFIYDFIYALCCEIYKINVKYF